MKVFRPIPLIALGTRFHPQPGKDLDYTAGVGRRQSNKVGFCHPCASEGTQTMTIEEADLSIAESKE